MKQEESMMMMREEEESKEEGEARSKRSQMAHCITCK
jgi:hypothetical protein